MWPMPQKYLSISPVYQSISFIRAMYEPHMWAPTSGNDKLKTQKQKNTCSKHARPLAGYSSGFGIGAGLKPALVGSWRRLPVGCCRLGRRRAESICAAPAPARRLAACPELSGRWS